MNLTSIKGNLCELPEILYVGTASNALRSWAIGDVGETIAFWALHKAKFWRIVKPFLIQYMAGDEIVNISSFISPNQIRHGSCMLPNEDERYYKEKILTEEQVKLTYRWDFLAVKIEKVGDRFEACPCLIDVKTQRAESGTSFTDSEYYKIFKKKCEDCSKEKEIGFKVFCLRIIVGDDWHFEARFKEL